MAPHSGSPQNLRKWRAIELPNCSSRSSFVIGVRSGNKHPPGHNNKAAKSKPTKLRCKLNLVLIKQLGSMYFPCGGRTPRPSSTSKSIKGLRPEHRAKAKESRLKL